MTEETKRKRGRPTGRHGRLPESARVAVSQQHPDDLNAGVGAVENDLVAQSESASLETLFAELAGVSNVNVTVYRQIRNQRPSYVFTCAPDQFSLDDLRDRYQGGEFRLYVTRDGKLIRNVAVSVDPKQVDAVKSDSVASVDLVGVMREGFARQTEVLREGLRAQAATATQGIDLPALIVALAGAMRPVPAPAPVVAPSNGEQAVNMLLKGIELARELRESVASDEDPSLLGLMRDLIRSPMAAQAIGNAMQNQASTQPPQPVSRPSIQSTAPKPEAMPASVDDSQRMISHYLSLLYRKAVEGSDPTLYADVALDSVPEPALRMLLARQPSAVDALIADFPAFAQQREWLAAFVAAVQHGLDAPEEPDEAPAAT